MNINRINEIHINTFGTKMKIVNYRKWNDIDVQFLDEHNFIKKHVTYSNFKKGKIKNPYDKCLYGVGAIGDGKFRVKVSTNGAYTQEYTAWVNMLKRCYYKRDTALNSAYIDKCHVCDDWLIFQNFASWFEKNKYQVDERLHVDKDIKNPNNKVYSPDNCLLVPQRINMLFLNLPNNKTLPNGIKRIQNGKFSAKYNNIELGTYNTLEEAYYIYSAKKKQEIVKIANEYKNIIPKEVYDALVDYEFSIENDKNYTVT